MENLTRVLKQGNIEKSIILVELSKKNQNKIPFQVIIPLTTNENKSIIQNLNM